MIWWNHEFRQPFICYSLLVMAGVFATCFANKITFASRCAIENGGCNVCALVPCKISQRCRLSSATSQGMDGWTPCGRGSLTCLTLKYLLWQRSYRRSDNWFLSVLITDYSNMGGNLLVPGAVTIKLTRTLNSAHKLDLTQRCGLVQECAFRGVLLLFVK